MSAFAFQLMILGGLFVGQVFYYYVWNRPKKSLPLIDDEIPSYAVARQFRLDHAIPAHGDAAVLLESTQVTAINESDLDLLKGTRVIVTRVDGPKVYVKKSRGEPDQPLDL